MVRSMRAAVTAGGAAVALLLAACGGGGDGSDQPANGEAQPITLHATSYNQFEVNFNPLTVTPLPGSEGMLYAPLMAYTAMKPGEGEPILAESMEFNDDGTAVTIKLRDGLTWSDGEALDADDVVYLFETYRDVPALNTSALPVEKATKVDDLTTEVTFSSPAFALAPSIGNVTPVPEHVFSSEDPEKFTNDKPVTSGPFVLGNFTKQLYTLTKNDKYWAADDIKVEELRYPASTTQSFNTSLQNGEFDWSGGFVSNIDNVFVKKDPEHNKYWYPGDGVVSLLMNLQNKPFDDLELRKAISLAIDRDELSEKAMQGYTPPAHPTGMPLPAFESFLDPQYADAKFERNVEEANAILDAAGYKKGSDGTRTTPDGKKLAFDLKIPSDYVDWVSIAQLLQEQLGEVGIKVAPQGISFDAWVQARGSGTYQMTITGIPGGSTPYFMYKAFMSGEYEVAKGEDAVQNFNRYYDAEADGYLADYASTDDLEQQKEAIHGLEKIAVEQLPTIPLMSSTNWFQYRTENWEGWPTEDDPYALPAPYMPVDTLLVVSHLTPAG